MKHLTTYATLTAFLLQLWNFSFFWLLAVPSVSYSPYLLANQLMEDTQANGRSVGPSMLGSLTVPQYNHNTGESSINYKIYDEETGTWKNNNVQMQRSDLFGMDSSHTLSEGQFTANGAYQNETRLHNSGVETSNRISANEIGNERDSDAAAYNTIVGAAGNRQHLNSDDSLMTISSDYLNQAAVDVSNPDSDFFSSCTTETNTINVRGEYVGTTEYQCQEPDRSNLDFCEIKRVVEYPVEKVGGTGAIEIIDDYTFDLIIGKEANNSHRGGACTLFPYFVDFKLRDDVEIDTVTLTRVWIDDMIEVSLDDELIYHYYGSRFDRMPEYSNEFNCEYSKSLVKGPNTRHEASFEKVRQENGGQIRFHLLLGVSDGGEGKAVVRVTTKNRISPIEHIEQNPVGCATQLGYVQPMDSCSPFEEPDHPSHINPQCDNPLTIGTGEFGAMCSFEDWECVSEAWHDESYDQYVSDMPITTGVLNNPKTCSKVNAVGYVCNPLPGIELCGMPNWPESSEEVCGDFTEINAQIPDSCAAYRDNADCTFVSSEPTFIDPETGKAYGMESTYECHVYTNTDYSYDEETDLCTGSMMCVGGDCNFANAEKNEDFMEAMGVFTMLEDIKGNNECTNPDDISTCEIFKGEPRYCGVEKTGLGFNCCTLSAGQTNMFDYVSGMYSFYKFDSQMATLTDTSGLIKGAWNSMPDTVHNSVNYVTDSFSSGYDWVVGNVTGETASTTSLPSVADIGDTVSEAVFDTTIDEFKQMLMQKAYEVLPESIGNAIFTTGGAGSAGGTVALNPAISTAFSAIAAAYAAYQVAKLALQMISECDDSEMEMGIKLDQGSCLKTGKDCHIDTFFGCLVERHYYCCYASPLGRIVMEQAAPMLGIAQNAQNGQCAGITFEDAANLDWSEIDLSEWEQILMASGVPVTHDLLNSDDMFKNDDTFLINAEYRESPDKLNQERFEEYDLGEIIKEEHDYAIPENLDCSVYPRPPVCDSAIVPIAPNN